MDYKILIYWLIDNTTINNETKIENKKLVVSFLDKFPEYNAVSNLLAFKIGQILNLIYGDTLIVTKDTGATEYNIELKLN